MVSDGKTILKTPLSHSLKKMRVQFSAETWGFEIVIPPVKTVKELEGKRLRRKSAIVSSRN